MQPQDATWMVTGASSGFGYAIAKAVLEAGGRVLAASRSLPSSLQELLATHPGRAQHAYLDVTDSGQAITAVESAVTAFGRLDVLVSNAGHGSFGALEEIPDQQLRALFDTNVFGSLNVVRAALPVLRCQRRGHIIQMSSLAGITPPAAGLAGYTASKFAVEGMMEGLARDTADLGIRITLVEPGDFRTQFGSAMAITPVQSPDYADTVGRTAEHFAQLDPALLGDPDRAAQAILSVVADENPPMRLALGADAVHGIRAKLTQHLGELNQWQELSQST